MTGLSEGYANWVDEATDYSSMAADGMKQAMGGAVTTITDMLNGNVDSWKDWGVSVLKIIQNVLVNMAVANGVSSIGSLFSFGASSAATASSGTAIQNAGANFTFNAKGNVYDSPSLSAYSNGVFQTPQLFAFAKGAGFLPRLVLKPLCRLRGLLMVRLAFGQLGLRRSLVVCLQLTSAISIFRADHHRRPVRDCRSRQAAERCHHWCH
jgi:lambda family phage tail tape measure protein